MKMDHLACFTPGMLALGAKYGAVMGDKAATYMELARNMTETCWQMYSRQPTGAPRGTAPRGALQHAQRGFRNAPQRAPSAGGSVMSDSVWTILFVFCLHF